MSIIQTFDEFLGGADVRATIAHDTAGYGVEPDAPKFEIGARVRVLEIMGEVQLVGKVGTVKQREHDGDGWYMHLVVIDNPTTPADAERWLWGTELEAVGNE